MANEATITTQLVIRRGRKEYQSLPASFQANVGSNEGPTPGTILVSTEGTDIDLSALTTPGLCRVQNLDPSNTIILGIWNPDQSEFYPYQELLPGESFVIRLARHINQEYGPGTGTGTTGQLNTWRAIAENADSLLLVEAHGR